MAFIKCSGGGKKYNIQAFPNVSLGGWGTVTKTYNDLTQVTCACGSLRWQNAYTRLIWSDDNGKTFKDIIVESWAPGITVNRNTVRYANSDGSSSTLINIFAIGY